MRMLIGYCLAVLRVLSTLVAESEEKKGASPWPSKVVAEQAIRAITPCFETAFHQCSATVIAASWTENGGDHDEDRIVHQGRTVIEQDDARSFADGKSSTIRVMIDSARLLCDAAAMEDSRAIASINRSAPAINKYSVLHAKIPGKGLMSAVRDMRLTITSTYTWFDDFEWLIGKWVPDNRGTKTDNESCLRTHH